MTYAAYEAIGGDPVLLASFTRGASVTRLAQYPTSLTKSANTYTASSATFPEEVSTNSKPEQEQVSFDFALSDTFAQSELAHSSTESKVVIYRTHISDPDEELRQVWAGYIEHARVNGDRIEVVCYSGRRRLDRTGAYRRAERGCPHLLYGTQCGAALASFQVSRNVTATSGTALTISASVSNEAQHQNGLLVWGSVELNIRSVSGTTLTLWQADAALAAAVASSGSEAVDIAPGCAKNLTSCAFFSNVPNFGGFPYMRDRELFAGRSAV